MKSEWLHKSANEKCILFMNGWGCDANPFQSINSKEYDVLMCFDYRDILIPKQVERLFENYQKVHLVAWSLGVYVANMLYHQWKDLFASKIAMNGTLQAIDNLKGIPPAIFQGTINGLNSRTIEKFWLRMCGGKNGFDRFKMQMPQRNVEDQKEELIVLQELVQNHFIDWNVYDSVLLGQNDLIFPFENLENAWREQNNIIKMENTPHFCFYSWNSWDDLMEECKSAASKY
ncbi:pimeloyl-ACP methyl esterase BioG family protein [Labilibaculum euxinus]